MAAPEPSEPLDTFVNPLRVPCFRQTMLHSLAGGTFMGCWRFYKSRPPSQHPSPAPADAPAAARWTPAAAADLCPAIGGAGSHGLAANTGVKSFVFLGVTSWALCRFRLVQELQQAELVRQQIEKQQSQVRQMPRRSDSAQE